MSNEVLFSHDDTRRRAFRSRLALDVFVELLSDIDTDTEPAEFYDRICEALCRLTTMKRAVVFLYEPTLRRVVPAGCHGVRRELLQYLHGSLEDTPVAARALATDEVQEISERLEDEVPARYASFLGISTLTCTPLSAAGRWLGVFFADGGGGRFKLTEDERHVMWTLGKLAAIATSARNATTQQERARTLSEQIELARDIHQRVIQRLFAVSLALGAEGELGPEDRERCRDEIRESLAELRSALERPLAPTSRETGTTLRAELERLAALDHDFAFGFSWAEDCEVPARFEPLAQSFLAEALQNARKHADPSRIHVRVDVADGTVVLEALNDGVRSGPARPPAGMGLRLAGLEAAGHGGVVEFGSVEDEVWRVRLVMPRKDDEQP
jgi:signal transduction histidine kinase